MISKTCLIFGKGEIGSDWGSHNGEEENGKLELHVVDDDDEVDDGRTSDSDFQILVRFLLYWKLWHLQQYNI